jgi:hypothetical protein
MQAFVVGAPQIVLATDGSGGGGWQTLLCGAPAVTYRAAWAAAGAPLVAAGDTNDAGSLHVLTDGGIVALDEGGGAHFGVWGNGPDDLWLVGAGPRTSRWSGGRMREIMVDPPAAPAAPVLRAVTGWGGMPTWAVGVNQTTPPESLIYRLQGRWRLDRQTPGEALTSVAQVSADEVWAVGPPQTIYRNAGAGWAPVALPAGLVDAVEVIEAVGGTSPTDVLVPVGCPTGAACARPPAVLEWDGAAWQRVPITGADATTTFRPSAVVAPSITTGLVVTRDAAFLVRAR